MDETRVRGLLVRYLAGEISLRELDSQLVPTSWDTNAPESLRALVDEIELRLDEYSSGACDGDTLRAVLLPFVTDYSISIGTEQNGTVHTGGSSLVFSAPISGQSIIADRSLVEAFE